MQPFDQLRVAIIHLGSDSPTVVPVGGEAYARHIRPFV